MSHPLDLHKLRIFATIAHFHNFTRAAEMLHMTQPTVSQQLAMLETQLGTPLIERQTRRLQLTAAGKALLPYAEQLLALADEATETTRAAAGIANRTLRLGVGHTLATYLLPDILKDYRTRHPEHLVRITVGNTSELLELVASDAVELALIGLPAHHMRVQITPFRQDHLVIIVSPDDAWSNRSEVYVEELTERTLLTREPGSALYATIEQLLGPTTLASDSVIQLGETEAIKRSVEAGLGVALVQSIAVDREVTLGSLCALQLCGGEVQRTYAFAQRYRRDLSPAAAELVYLLTTQK
ncbi:MAG: hypothetical protein GFH25_541198n96 [Chloroflexi bacterium AL-N10]|nr:hypothetical protein [Chloroflexi bacterium AL-N1]NOK68622.1 hypothetical protein [Chloroflexi bacterium AL-N10]NOK76108.1 hypothetical protein [Chloroflexi bacterium AL-N5]NOK93379.1 hypothetical protein [Chloroflexi bacterium AL-N15]